MNDLKRLLKLSSANRFHLLMEELGFVRRVAPIVLAAAMDLYDARLDRAKALQNAEAFFRERAIFVPKGLEQLPSIWLKRLPDIFWSCRNPGWEILPFFIRVVGIELGVLRLGFPQEQCCSANHVGGWDQLRVVANLSLRPNLWTALTRHEERELWDLRPELRHDMLTVM